MVLDTGSGQKVRASQWLKRPEVRITDVATTIRCLVLSCRDAVASLDEVSAETEVKYEGYLRRQATEIERSRREEDLVDSVGFRL